MGVGSGGEVFEVEALAEVFGTLTNLVVGFLQCPDDLEFIARNSRHIRNIRAST